jgi:two-component system, NarL family, nitrate/nitrite response regulator NarL
MEYRQRPVRVVIAEDHPVFREGLLSVLQASEVMVLAAVGDAESALTAVRSGQPDVVLMDLALPGMTGCDPATGC